MIKGVNPKSAAEYEYNMGYRMISGKIFKLNNNKYTWVPVDDFRHHIMSAHYATTASDIQSVLDVFSALYNQKAKWPAKYLTIYIPSGRVCYGIPSHHYTLTTFITSTQNTGNLYSLLRMLH